MRCRGASPEGVESFVRREELSDHLAGELAGVWALEALRVAAGRPRFGLETDHRTIPHEVGWIPSAVHLDKGCYRGQETVARVQNLGRPPRRLVLLHLDGSDSELPATGDPVVLDGPRGRSGDELRRGTTSSARSRWPSSSGRRPRTPTWSSVRGGVAASQEVLVPA